MTADFRGPQARSVGDSIVLHTVRALAYGSGALLCRLHLPAQIFFSFLPSSVPLTSATPLHTLRKKKGVKRLTEQDSVLYLQPHRLHGSQTAATPLHHGLENWLLF